ncbi:unnamed protein product [Linum trigynum]
MPNRQSYPEADMFLALASPIAAQYGSPLEVAIRTGESYSFPEGSFSHCSRTKVLKLDGGDIKGLGKVSVHGLQVLHLDNLVLTEQLLYDFVASARNLESLSLGECFEIGRLEISVGNFPKLKTLSIHARGDSKLQELLLTTAPFLESLVFIKAGNPCKLRTVSSSAAPKLKFARIDSCDRQFSRLDLDDFIMKLPSLQDLYLARVCLKDKLLCTLMANTPNLRSLRFSSYFHWIDKVEISHGSLSSLEIAPKGGQFRYQIEFKLTSTPFLETLKIADFVGLYKLNVESLSAAPNLKVLEFTVPEGFTQGHLDGLISMLPYLESLYLVRVNGTHSEMRRLRVSSHQLRVFKLRDAYEAPTKPMRVLKIDAPNLVSVQYKGNGLRFPDSINVLNVASDCRFVVQGYGKIGERSTQLKHEWFLRLRQSLWAVSRFHLVLQLRSLELSKQQAAFDLRVAERISPPWFVQRLDLETSSSDVPDEHNCNVFLGGLFWACRPKSICIPQKHDADRKFVQLICEQFKNKDGANCCVGAKCWRHDLREVKIENASFDHNNTTIDVSRKEDPSLANLAEVLFRLTWG